MSGQFFLHVWSNKEFTYDVSGLKPCSGQQRVVLRENVSPVPSPVPVRTDEHAVRSEQLQQVVVVAAAIAVVVGAGCACVLLYCNHSSPPSIVNS